jgi:drug/metabolite transporter (DMT)-like permease
LETWVLLSLGAAFLQNLRSALQKALTPRVGVPGAAYARFVFAAPWAVALVAVMAGPLGMPLPRPTPAFALWALAGAFGQIAGTLLLLRLFSLRNFAVGNTFAKTETVQAALLGLVLIGDRIGLLPFLAMLVSLTGILILSGSTGPGRGALNRAAGIGLLCGAAFAVSGVAYRGAGLALEGEAGFLMRAAVTLACVTVFQTVVMAPWVARQAPGALGAVLRQWRVAAPVGLAGMLASLGWFAALTLVPAAQVKAVGQVELVFAWITARLAFGERPSLRETLGIALVSGGIVALVLTA